MSIGIYECVKLCVFTRSGGNYYFISSSRLYIASCSVRTTFTESVHALANDAHLLTSDQTRVLAEFKHIIKRRKRN